MKRKFRGRNNFKPDITGALTGTVDANERGFAFIRPDGGGKDYFVPKGNLCGAFHGDRVLFAHVRGTDDEAVILKITARNPSPVVGTAIVRGRSIKLFPDDPKRPVVAIPRDMSLGVGNGFKAVCTVTGYPAGRLPTGKIQEILGEEGELFAEELSIIRKYGLREQFGGEAVKAAKAALKQPVLPDGRRDLRDKIIFTVDGEDTRDMDDAVSIEEKDGNFILGVHIADVSFYVKHGSAADAEAYERGTSVYFPDRVLPMLPAELSNGICSLNEGEARYALTVELTFGKDGGRLKYDIYESIIKSRAKMTYPEVTAICEGNAALREKYGEICTRIDKMKELCLILEGKRKLAGCVDMNVKEAHICLDESGKILIPQAGRGISERMIEQFMIAANEAAAEFLRERKLPCLYRIHERPEPEKAEKFAAFLRDLGINAKFDAENAEPKDYMEILDNAADKPYAAVVNKVALRSMQKARYSDENSAHFGLASDCYCHFTSPIRRYPDLFVHRVIKSALHKKEDKNRETYADFAKKAGRDCSDRERIAEAAERDVDSLYILAYMSERLGEEFEGIISGVTAHGLYCELENAVEGFVPIEDLPADRYEFNGDRLWLTGAKHAYKLGQPIKVAVAACDLGRMKVIFKICGIPKNI